MALYIYIYIALKHYLDCRLSGISPFLGDNDSETYANISEEDYEFDEDYFGALSEDSLDFLEKLLVKDPK